MIIVDLDMINWRRRVFMLLALEKKAKTRKEKELIKMGWDNIWNVFPYQDYKPPENKEIF